MADASDSNFGGADGGGTVDPTNGSDDGRSLNSAAINGEPGSPTNPLAFKRGRGRPRKDGSAAGSTNASGATGPEQSAGKVGGKKSTQLDVELFAKQLQGGHMLVATLTKNPIWMIDGDEAKMLAKALLDVMAQHSISIDPKNLAYIKLLGAILMIHGGRLLAMQMKAAKEKKAEADRTVDMPVM